MTNRAFPLEPVLRFRTLVADQAMAQLAELERQRSELLQAMRATGERQLSEQTALRTYQLNPVQDAAEVRRHMAALEAARYDLGLRQGALAQIDQAILLQRMDVKHKRVDQESLRVLKDRHLQRIRAREERQEVLALEEAAAVQAARRRVAA